MKKLLLVFCAAIALFSSCRNDSDLLSLKERINTANIGDVIDLGKEVLKIEEGDSFTISKPLTIKNGNVKNAMFTVESDKVVFDSLKNINIVTVNEKVGNGGFRLRSCYCVNEVYVSGGENSIYIAKTTVEKLVINKKGVRVVLSGNGSAKVVEALISEDCKLDSENERNFFVKVVIEKTVENLELAGKTKVEKIFSSERTGSEAPVIKIIVSVDVKIVWANESVKKSIKETPGNEEFNKKNPDVSESDTESSGVKNLDFLVVDNNKHVISEKSDVVPYPVETISEINVEKTDSEVIVTNSAAFEDYSKIWDYWIFSKTPIEAEKGKNYKISFDLKAEKTSRIYLSTRDALTLDDSIYFEYNVGTEYETYSIETGIALNDWAMGVLQIAIGSASKLYIKNYKIEEISEKRIGYGIYIADKNDSISCKAAEDSITVTFESVKVKSEEKDGNSGVNIYPILHKVGKLHKVTFDVTCDKEVSDVTIWADSNAVAGESSGAGTSNFSFDSTKKTVALYVPAYQETDEEFRTLRVWVATETPCSLTFSNFNSEETDLDSVMKNDESLGLYFVGHILISDADNGLWRVVPIDKPVQIPAGAKAKGQILLCGPENWNSVVTSFRLFAEGTIMTKEEDGDDVIFSNDSSEPVSLKFSINEELKVVVNRETVEDI